MKFILTLIAASVLSTMTMDIAGGLLRSTGVTQGAPAGLVGKWIESSLKGTVFVGDIRTSRGELVPVSRFLLYHYLIGMFLTCTLYAIIAILNINSVPWWIPALYGLATTVLPLFVMFPGMGYGLLGLNGPPEYLLARTAILNHSAFGVGLMITFRWLLKV